MPVQEVDGRVSVVMITHNRSAEVLHTLEQLTRLPEQPQIIVVDNGSTDGTATAVNERFAHIEVVTAGNLGAAGRTLGVQRASTPYVAFCDDDTWYDPGCLRRAADLFDTHPGLALITGRVLVGPEEREDPICREMECSPLPAEPGLPGRPVLGFLAGATVVRRAAYLEAGGFNERFNVGGEEGLLAVDLAAKGWRLNYVPEIIVHHYPSQQRDQPKRRWHQLRNALWFAWLRRPFLCALRRTFGMMLTQPWDRVTLKGFTAALRGLPWILRERRILPGSVEQGLRLLEVQR